MCAPIMIAGAILMVASTVMSMVASQQVQAARDDALSAERIRQDGYNREAEGLVDSSRDQYKDFNAKREDRAGQLADYFAPANTNTQNPGLLPGSDSSITVATEKGARNKAGAQVRQQSDALANLRSFGDLFGDDVRGQAANAAHVGMIGSFKKGSAAILPLELDQASHAGDTINMIGSITGALGKGLLSFGAGSIGGAAGSAGAAMSGMGVGGGSMSYGGPR